MKGARLVLSLLLGTPLIVAAEPSKQEQLHLAGSVRVIFERKCNECHGSHLKKPEGKFGYVLDLQRIADNEDYVIRGDAKKSEIFRMVRDGEMPPDDHPKTPPLTEREKALVRRWISAGAPAELPDKLPEIAEDAPVEPAAADAAASLRDRAARTGIALTVSGKPAGEIIADIAAKSGLKVVYHQPAHEPVLSIQMKNGHVLEALNYLALCGNLAITFTTDAIVIGPASPPAKGG